MVFVKYPQKSQMLRDIDDEMAGLFGGSAGSSKYIKNICRQRIDELKWQRARVEHDQDIDAEHMPKCLVRQKVCVL